jgi:hypothetical protein
MNVTSKTPVESNGVRSRFDCAMRAGDYHTAQEIAVILASFEPEDDGLHFRPIDAWGIDR